MIRNPRLAFAPSGTSAAELTRVRVALEDVLLPIAQRTAARLRGAQERGERLHVGVVLRQAPHEALALRRRGRGFGEQHEHRTLRAEVFAQARLELLEPRGQARRAHELQAELVNLLDERVVASSRRRRDL